jgi:arylsulfatase A
VRMGYWKGVRQSIAKAKTSAQIKTELYNLKSDPGEKNNVAAKNPAIMAQIEAIMVREHTPSSLFPILPEERRRKRPRK